MPQMPALRTAIKNTINNFDFTQDSLNGTRSYKLYKKGDSVIVKLRTNDKYEVARFEATDIDNNEYFIERKFNGVNKAELVCTGENEVLDLLTNLIEEYFEF